MRLVFTNTGLAVGWRCLYNPPSLIYLWAKLYLLLPHLAVYFFLTQAHLTNSSGVYYRTGSPLAWVQIADNSDTSALTQSLTALTTRVTTLEGEKSCHRHFFKWKCLNDYEKR